MVHWLMHMLHNLYHCMLRAWGPRRACHVSSGFSHLLYTLADAHQRAANQVWLAKPKFHLIEELFQYQIVFGARQPP